MPHYHSLGKVPVKRHTQFKKSDGSLFSEQHLGTIGFNGMYSNAYHTDPPTTVKKIIKQYSIAPEIERTNNIQSYKFLGFNIAPQKDYLSSRTVILINSDCSISIAAPQESMRDYFYKNTDADEVIFVHQGEGTLRTFLGNLSFKKGDYLVIPRGTIYQITFDTRKNRLLITESTNPVYIPKRYLNQFGQLMEHAPYCERDIRVPNSLETHEEAGTFLLKVKKQNELIEMSYAHHPFNVVGYDGFYYPWALSIYDFEPITGRIHQPPPVHQTFETSGFVICSFVPRLYDYHPQAIPAPYNHSNIDSDEVLYYVDGNFMSRKGVEPGQISLHPSGIPHGPHPGAVEASIGKQSTNELAVMIDTFKPLQITKAAMKIADENYYQSWLKK